MYVMNHTNYTQQTVRRGLMRFVAKSDFTHALTLNADRELSVGRMRSVFSNLCMNVDRKIHGRQRVRGIPSSERFRAIAFPEHLESNAHLHVSADLRQLEQFFPFSFGLHTFLEETWLKATRGAGSFYMKPMTSEGWAWYLTKQARSPDPVYFLAADFHPL